jgi:hypothetical protein
LAQNLSTRLRASQNSNGGIGGFSCQLSTITLKVLMIELTTFILKLPWINNSEP